MPSSTAAKRGVTYQFKGHLTRDGHALLDQRLAENRRLYNAALEERIGAYKQGRAYGGEHRITFKSQSEGLTDVRRDDPAYDGCMRRIQVSTLQRLDKALSGILSTHKGGRKTGIPAFQRTKSLPYSRLAQRI